MRPTNEIDDPNWNDIHDRDRLIQELYTIINDVASEICYTMVESPTGEEDLYYETCLQGFLDGAMTEGEMCTSCRVEYKLKQVKAQPKNTERNDMLSAFGAIYWLANYRGDHPGNVPAAAFRAIRDAAGEFVPDRAKKLLKVGENDND